MGGYILDFYCPLVHLGIELDGGVHRSPEQSESDHVREQDLARMGVFEIRFWNSQVLNDLYQVLLAIEKSINSKKQKKN